MRFGDPEHGRRKVDADDLLTVGGERHCDAPGAAPDIEHGPAGLGGEATVEVDITVDGGARSGDAHQRRA